MVKSTINGINILAEGSITVNKSKDALFDYVADLRNDKQWRAEILKTEIADQEVALNIIAAEHSYLSKKVPDHTYELRCTSYIRGNKVVYETTPSNRFHLTSCREVVAISESAASFVYKLEFDSSIAKHALGFRLPQWLIAWKAKSDMKKYLKRLQTLMA